MPMRVGQEAVVEAVGGYAVGHIDITAPVEPQLAGTGGSREGEQGVMIVRGERAGLIAAVESKDAETVFGSRELGGTEIGGVESAPYGVEIAAGRTDTDIIAHNIGVGTGIPTEAYLTEGGVDAAKTQRAGCGGHIVLKENADSVG